METHRSRPSPRLTLSDVTCTVDGRAVIRSTDLALDSGDCLCLVGENGAGKSTLLQILAGHRLPTSGSVRTHGHDVLLLERSGMAKLAHLPACDAVAAIGGVSSVAAEADLLTAGFTPDRPIESFSPGERQKILLIIAAASPAGILLLDAPTSELDAAGREQFFSVVPRATEAQKCVVVTTTDPEVVIELQNSAIASIVDGRLEMVRPFPPRIEEILSGPKAP